MPTMLIQTNHIPYAVWRVLKQWRATHISDPPPGSTTAPSRISDHLIILCDRPHQDVIDRMDALTPARYAAVQAIAVLPDANYPAWNSACIDKKDQPPGVRQGTIPTAYKMATGTFEMVRLCTGYHPDQFHQSIPHVALAYGDDPDILPWVRNAVSALHPATMLFTFGPPLRAHIGRHYHYYPRRINALASTTELTALDTDMRRKLKIDE